jgi:hypothetical protein
MSQVIKNPTKERKSPNTRANKIDNIGKIPQTTEDQKHTKARS